MAPQYSILAMKYPSMQSSLSKMTLLKEFLSAAELRALPAYVGAFLRTRHEWQKWVRGNNARQLK